VLVGAAADERARDPDGEALAAAAHGPGDDDRRPGAVREAHAGPGAGGGAGPGEGAGHAAPRRALGVRAARRGGLSAPRDRRADRGGRGDVQGAAPPGPADAAGGTAIMTCGAGKDG